jgi:hypothetical protein
MSNRLHRPPSRPLAGAVLGTTLLGLLAGCGPSLTVVRQAAPNPFSGQKSWSLEGLRFDGLMVGKKTEADFLAGKQPDQRQSWNEDKAGMRQEFQARLAAASIRASERPMACASSRQTYAVRCWWATTDGAARSSASDSDSSRFPMLIESSWSIDSLCLLVCCG